MKQILLLFKAYIAGGSLLSRLKTSSTVRDKRQRWLLPLIAVSLVAALGSYGSLLVVNYRSLYQLGAMFGHPDFLIYMSIFFSWVLTLVLTFPSAISIFYRSHDIQLLLTLPLRDVSIVGARTAVLFSTALPLHLFICDCGQYCRLTGAADSRTGSSHHAGSRGSFAYYALLTGKKTKNAL